MSSKHPSAAPGGTEVPNPVPFHSPSLPSALSPNPPPLVLASASPRRRRLLARMGVDLVVCPVDLVEDVLADESPWQTARRLALSKLQLARQRDRNATVLTADTVVDLDGVALGKPVSEAEAWWMLRDLRGRTHRVHTAVAAGKPGIEACVVSTSRVWMREYTDAEIAAYIAAREPFDKAGAYGIHNLRFGPVRAVRGLYTTVLGLPAPPAARLLSRLGVPNSYDASLEIELRSHL